MESIKHYRQQLFMKYMYILFKKQHWERLSLIFFWVLILKKKLYYITITNNKEKHVFQWYIIM